MKIFHIFIVMYRPDCDGLVPAGEPARPAGPPGQLDAGDAAPAVQAQPPPRRRGGHPLHLEHRRVGQLEGLEGVKSQLFTRGLNLVTG